MIILTVRSVKVQVWNVGMNKDKFRVQCSPEHINDFEKKHYGSNLSECNTGELLKFLNYLDKKKATELTWPLTD